MVSLTNEEITRIAKTVGEFTTDENNCISSEEQKLNELLDSINSFKKALSEKTVKVKEINERINELKEYDQVDHACILFIRDVITSARELHSLLISQYISMNSIQVQGIAKEVISDFKSAIDDLMKSNMKLERLNKLAHINVGIPAKKTGN
jgi:hypothetical protein